MFCPTISANLEHNLVPKLMKCYSSRILQIRITVHQLNGIIVSVFVLQAHIGGSTKNDGYGTLGCKNKVLLHHAICESKFCLWEGEKIAFHQAPCHRGEEHHRTLMHLGTIVTRIRSSDFGVETERLRSKYKHCSTLGYN